jgi:hypothetical protein
MRRRGWIALLPVLAGLSIFAAVAVAGSPHFIANEFSVSRTDNTITVSGKEAGLGDEAGVHIVLTATASCINPGDHHPKAENKTSVSAEGYFPVQNGKADFTLSATATFQPSCSPPMTVEFGDVTITDTTNGISKSFSGPF